MYIMTFSLDIKEFAKKVDKNIDDVGRTVAIDLFSAIVKQSPVDTGRFRNNWNASINGPDLSTIETTDKSGEKAISGIVNTAKAFNFSAEGTIFLSNNLPYAQRLEYGWSKQAPSGMVRVNIARFQSAINKAIQSLPK
jgi:hypothetical protein